MRQQVPDRFILLFVAEEQVGVEATWGSTSG